MSHCPHKFENLNCAEQLKNLASSISRNNTPKIYFTFTCTVLIRKDGSHYANIGNASVNKVMIMCAVQNYLQQENCENNKVASKNCLEQV